MTLQQVNLLAESGILGALFVFGVWRSISSGWITRWSEIDALRAVLRSVGPPSNTNEFDRNAQISTLRGMLTLHDLNRIPIIFVTTQTLAHISPLIDEVLEAAATPDDERDVLAAFKDRMSRQKFWPRDPGSQSTPLSRRVRFCLTCSFEQIVW